MLQGLKELILHAYKNVPYYKEVFDKEHINPNQIEKQEDLGKLPIVSKEVIINNADKFIAQCDSADSLLKETTSGSSGIPLTIYKSSKDKVKQAICLWKYRVRRFGITTESNYCTWRIKGANIYTHNNRMEFSAIKLTDKDLHEYAVSLNKHQPEWLFGSAEAWRILAEFMKKNGYTPPDSLKFIENTGELLREQTEKVLVDYFGCPVVNMYGCSETFGLAISCSHGNLHCMEENVMLEIVGPEGEKLKDGEEGEILVTSLCNYAMPFIRYRIGDRGKIVNTKCSCGSSKKQLILSKARVNEVIELEDGGRMDSNLFHYAFERINRNDEYSILQFKVIQTKYNEFDVYVVLEQMESMCAKLFENHFCDEIANYGLDNCIWNFKFVNRIEMNKVTGKYQYFINKIQG